MQREQAFEGDLETMGSGRKARYSDSGACRQAFKLGLERSHVGT